ncbi:type II toxin-antitoxin system RelE/ParE family toxin [Holdemanella biformis]|uniref:type II toxin-antitoxin system RelE/ParE family toxin n=1 Tax=Holdemanella biformis TaxID=1735 RepID=UPI00319E7B2D
MAYKYFFTDEAQIDLDNILDYLTNHLCNLHAAKSFYILLIERLALVCDFPESNPMIKNRFLGFHEVRKMVIKNYLIYYYVDENNKTINVLSIRHSLENQEKII